MIDSCRLVPWAISKDTRLPDQKPILSKGIIPLQPRELGKAERDVLDLTRLLVE